MVDEKFVKCILFFCSLSAIFIVLCMLIFILIEGFPIIVKYNLDFFFGKVWYPNPIEGEPRFGILPMMISTLYVCSLALLIATPVGIGAAIFLAEYAPEWLRNPIKTFCEMLVGIPSVVLGFFGLIVIVPWIKNTFGGYGSCILAGSIILAIMTLPHIISISEDALRAVPKEFKEASLALGATRWQTLTKVLLPTAGSGILASIILGLANALGETMAVLMVVGNPNIPFIPKSILDPVRVLTSTIVIDMRYAVWGSEHTQALFAIGVVLFFVVAALNLLTVKILKRGWIVKT